MKHTFDFFNKEDKHFFAGLFNTAINNFNLSLSELDKRINTKQNNALGIIDYAFNENRTQMDFDNSFKYLSESLTFLNRLPSFIKNKNKNEKINIVLRGYLKDFLKKLYHTINAYRNFYTHYHHDAGKLNNDVADFLNYIIFNSASRVKDERAKTEEWKKKLSDKENYADDFSQIFDEKNLHIDDLNKKIEEENKTSTEKKKRVPYIKLKDKTNFVINRMFQFFLNDKKQTILNEYIKSNPEDNELTRGGLIQLLALLLSKRQINLLFDNVNYTYNEDDTKLQKKIVRWVYTHESYSDIKRLYRSEYDKDALLLQMVSELSKCPTKLYPYLNDKDKNEFIEDVNTYLKENEHNYDKALVSHEVIRKRYEDKFPYFAIRFLDEFAGFPSLRFHVNMGKFCHKPAIKTFKSTNKKTERRILEKITIFEMLSEAARKKKEYFEREEELKESDWIEFPRPKYQFFGHNIGIWLKGTGLGNSDAPQHRNGKKLSKYDVLEKIGKGFNKNLKKPVAYLSFNELPALLYELLRNNKSATDIEDIIRNKIIEQKRFMSNLSAENIPKENWAKNLRKTANSKEQTDYDKLKRHLKDEKEVKPLEEIRELYKKKPKNENILSLSEKGKLATWLSYDIKRFVAKKVKRGEEESQDKSGAQKKTTDKTKEGWKGYQFSEFQALLSYYDIDKSHLAGFLSTELRCNIHKDFPFDGIDFSKDNLYKFYLHYLNKRKDYLSKLLNKLNDEGSSNEMLRPFDERKFKFKTLKEYKEAQQKHPYMLLRGIFDNKPTAAKKENKGKTEFANWFKVSMDRENAQRFYNLTKHYPVNNVVKNRIEADKGLKEQYYDVTKPEQQRQIYKNEAAIRKTMRNDFYVLQMIKHFFRNAEEANTASFKNITLKDFYLSKKEKEHFKKQSELQSHKQKGDKTDNVFNESYILSKPVNIKLFGGKVEGKVALKDIGKYKKLSQDTKVKLLTEYFEKKWSIEDIAKEINHYEHIRSKEFFKAVHKLEAKIYNIAKENECLELLKHNGNPSFRKYVEYYFIKDTKLKEEFDTIDIETLEDINNIREELTDVVLLVQIRNKFAHNQLIPVAGFQYLTKLFPIESNEKVAGFLNRAFGELILKL